MAKTKRRVRSPHPGVKLKKRALPKGGFSWRAVYKDVDTGKDVYFTLDRATLSTAAARTQWAKAKSAELSRVRMDRAAGIRAPSSLSIEAGLARYMLTAEATLKPKTLEGHRLAHRQLERWAAATGVRETGNLTRAMLVDLRDHLIRAPRRYAARGGCRGARVAKDQRRSPVTVNRELRSLKALMNTWRKLEMLSGLHSDDIGDALKSLPTAREEPVYLSASDLQRLIQSSLRHDADVFTATRQEHAGERVAGTTRRYRPIAPFLVFTLLTGLRRGEALKVDWSMVDLDAPDDSGKRVGEIRLPAAATKTNEARTVGLEVSPMLRKILSAMKLRSGGNGFLFADGDGYTVDIVVNARRRLRTHFGAPDFSWQVLRSTCASYLTNAPAIYGAASAYKSTRQLGHSFKVAQRSYLGIIRGISRDARTLDTAMQIEGDLADVLSHVQSGSAWSAAG